jgi:hypothetical protein
VDNCGKLFPHNVGLMRFAASSSNFNTFEAETIIPTKIFCVIAKILFGWSGKIRKIVAPHSMKPVLPRLYAQRHVQKKLGCFEVFLTLKRHRLSPLFSIP